MLGHGLVAKIINQQEAVLIVYGKNLRHPYAVTQIKGAQFNKLSVLFCCGRSIHKNPLVHPVEFSEGGITANHYRNRNVVC